MTGFQSFFAPNVNIKHPPLGQKKYMNRVFQEKVTFNPARLNEKALSN